MTCALLLKSKGIEWRRETDHETQTKCKSRQSKSKHEDKTKTKSEKKGKGGSARASARGHAWERKCGSDCAYLSVR